MNHAGHRLSGADVIMRQSLVLLNTDQEGVKTIQMVPVWSGKMSQGLVQFLVPGQSLVSGLGEMFQTFGQVVTMIFTQPTKPFCSGKLAASLFQRMNKFT